MGKASSNKKVARAAGTGGGRTAGVRRPYGWYTVLTCVAALGIFLVAFSRHQQQAAAAIHPTGNDHWHAAYSVDICGTIEPNLPQNPNLVAGGTTPPPGLHTHGDGLIHIEPFVSALSADAGNHATLARFAATYPGLKLTSTLIQYPGQPAKKNGDKCGTKPAEIRIRVWPKASQSGSITFSNPSDVHLKDGEAITIAFLPLTDDIPKPPKANLDQLTNPTAAEPTASTPSTIAPTVSVVPTAPAKSTPSTAPTASTSPTASTLPTPPTAPPGRAPPSSTP